MADSFIFNLWEDSEESIWLRHPNPRRLTILDPANRTFRRLIHDPEDPESLAPARQNNGSVPLEDELGRVWIGTSDAGFNVIDKATLKVLRVQHDPEDPESLAHNDVDATLQGRDGTLWIATNAGLQRRLEPSPDGKERFEYFPHDPNDPTTLPTNTIRNLFEDPDSDSIWVGTNEGLARFDPVAGKADRFLVGADYPVSVENLNGRPPFAVGGVVGPNGYLWVGTLGGLTTLDRATGEVVRQYGLDPENPRGLSSLNLRGARVDREGDLWLGSDSGVFRYSPETDDFDVFAHDPADPKSLGDNNIQVLQVGSSGTLWIGTFGGGVSSYSRSKHKFSHYAADPQDPEGLGANEIFSLLLDSDGGLWVGTQRGGLFRYSTDRRRVIEHYSALPGDPRDIGNTYAAALYEDSDGKLWVGTNFGIAKIDREQGVVEERFVNDPSNDQSLGGNNVLSFHEDSEGGLWVTGFAGVDRLDRTTGTFEHFGNQPDRPETNLPQTRIRHLEEDGSGGLWMATEGGLCRMVVATEAVTCFSHDPKISSSLAYDTVMDFWQAPDSTLWVATYGGGLDHFDPSTGVFEHLTTKNGLPNNSLYSVQPDTQNKLWISSNHGLTRFDPVSRTIENYDVDDGLQANEFNDRAFFASQDGELFFGGLNGFNTFRPEKIVPSSFAPAVVLTAFRKVGKKEQTLRTFEGLEEVVVSFRDLGFSFEFASLDFTTPNKNSYQYRLEGFDDGWIESGHRRFASYTNLDGGLYTFRVLGTNSDGVWSDQEASIRVRVIPPPWKTWWAYTLYIGLALGCVFGYVRFKTVAQEREIESHRQEAERLKQIDQMKDEFLANTSHELRTPLNGIIGITESIMDGATGEVSSKTQDNLQMVASSGRRLAHLVDDILDFSKLKNHEIVLREQAVSLRELVEVTLILSRPLVAESEVELVNGVEEGLPLVAADENRLQQILHNLIGNAVKFTRQGEVRVTARVVGERIEVAVEDTGVGIEADKLEKIFESFQQADASSAREFGGTGLGLTITRQLVELHGGQIEVTSIPGEGSRFSFRLPQWDGEVRAISADPADSRPLAGVREHPLGSDYRPLNIPVPTPTGGYPATEAAGLVALNSATEEAGPVREVLCVDDEPVNLQVLENLLSLEGYRVRRANDGLECLEFLRQGLVPDLVLLDVMMPRMTGYEVARTIRADFPAHELPIVMVTAKNQVSDLVEGLSTGANDYLSKPFSKQELLARVRTHIDLSKAHKAEAENQRKTEEMRQARAIQLSLLPKAPPPNQFFDFAVHLETASEVGGDYYDFFPQADGSVFVVTGDATGHGISAGMMVSMTKSALKALDVNPPNVMLDQLNAVMRAVDLTRMQMALNVAYIEGGTINLSSAAMPPAYHYRGITGQADEVLLPGLPLGAMSDPIYRLITLETNPGDALVLVSDGLPELVDRRDGGGGYEAMEDIIAAVGEGSAQEILDALIASVAEADRPLEDDITVVVAKRK